MKKAVLLFGLAVIIVISTGIQTIVSIKKRREFSVDQRKLRMA